MDMWIKNNKKLTLVLLFLYWLITNYLVLHTPFSIFRVAEVTALSDVTSIASAAQTPQEIKHTNWLQQALPDVWFESGKTDSQYWYRTSLYIDNPAQQTWAIYLPTVTHNAAVFINGIWIGQSGGFEVPVSRHHNEPLFFSFARELLRPGSNEVMIRVKASFHEQGLLGPIYLAPYDELYPAYEFKHFVRVDMIEWVTTAMYLMGLIVLVFWLARPQDIVYGIFSIELFFWATHNLNLVVNNIPFSTRLWEALIMSTLGWTVITMIYFNHRFIGVTRPRIEKLALTCAILGIGLFLLPDIAAVLHVGYRIWDVLLVIIGLYLIVFLLQIYWKDPQTDYYLMLLVGIPILIFGLHDILVVNHFANPGDGLIIQYSVIPAALLFSWFMVRRFVKSINQAENLAENLEQIVQAKEQEIRAQYEKLKEMEKHSVLSEERERIMRDMHDGIGGQLLSVIALSKEQQGKIYETIHEKVQHSLTDLRFVIDSLDPLLNELPILLGTMRYRLHDQLDSAKIDLEWAVTDLPEIPQMSPGRGLHIMRIVQEAITNCIKHSETPRMTVATGTIETDRKHVYIDIIDYGKGIHGVHSENYKQGRGIRNMQYRAKQIGAILDWDSNNKGTRVRLLIALAPGK